MGSAEKPPPARCEFVREGFTPTPASAWNIKKDGKPVPVCGYHWMAKSVGWKEGLRLFLVWKVNSE